MPSKSKPTNQDHETPKNYENNPFFIAVKGITTFVNVANGLFVLALLFSVFEIFTRSSAPEGPDPDKINPQHIADTLSAIPTQDLLLALGALTIISVALAMVSALFSGVSSLVALSIAKGKNITISQAFSQAFEHLWPYLWLKVIACVKVFLWSLLFVIPGVIAYLRYSMAGVLFFDKGLRGNAALKASSKLTKDGLVTTFASLFLFNAITFATLTYVVNPSVIGTLYAQFTSAKQKPSPHILSWVITYVPGVALAILVALLFLGISTSILYL